MSKDFGFLVDTSPLEDESTLNSSARKFPSFRKSWTGLGLSQKEEESENSESENESEDTDEYYGLPPPSISIKNALEKCPIKNEFFESKSKTTGLVKEKRFKDNLLNDLDDYLNELRPKKFNFVTDGIEAMTDISKLGLSDNQLKKFNRREREKTKGANWFNMKAPELTEELKNDVEILQMRAALDPKRFYKRNEMKTIPKYFEIGQVVEAPVEYHNTKNVRRKKRTLVEDLLEDAEFQKYNKKKYKESLEQKKVKGYNKAIKKMKKLKKNK